MRLMKNTPVLVVATSSLYLEWVWDCGGERDRGKYGHFI